MKNTWRWSDRPEIRLLVILIAFLGIPTSASFGDEVKEVRYGVIEGRRPTEISKGLFGLRDKPGMAYTIKLVQASGRLEVDSLNVSFLVGDCIAVTGEDDKTTLARAESHLCISQAMSRSVVVHKGNLIAHGANSDQCAQARAESTTWPQGLGRHRALLRELMICGQSPGTVTTITHPLGQPCSEAWAKVERIPFGLERARARLHAREVCR